MICTLLPGCPGKRVHITAGGWAFHFARRYNFGGFHNQKQIGSVTSMIRYIEKYLWEKHLEAEECTRIKIDEENMTDIINSKQMRIRWFRQIFNKIQKTFAWRVGNVYRKFTFVTSNDIIGLRR